MKPPTTLQIALIAIVLMVAAAVAFAFFYPRARRGNADVSTVLSRYVRLDDNAYTWEKVAERKPPGQGVVIHDLRLTSQVWQGITWRHTLRILVPQTLAKRPTLALLIIVGGSNGEEELTYGTLIANRIAAPVAILHDIPNQPLLGGLREDELIAETFVRFLETGDRTWLLLLPMVKSAVKAMDAVQAFMQEETDVAVSGFVVTGASKRGWTTWLTPVVDRRVKAIAPMVYDNLNLSRQMQHQLEAWGEFSEKIADYTQRNLPQRLIDGQGREADLAAIVDPFAYRAQITIPKLIIVGTNDRYWPLDALNLYYSDLIGEKHIFYVPNGGHDLEGGEADAIGDVMALFLNVDRRLTFPKMAWQFGEESGRVTLTLTSDIAPVTVHAWTTTSPTTDFRNARWQDTPMVQDGATYTYTLDTPTSGHAALFGEVIYLLDGFPLRLSTTVRLVP